MLTNGQAPRAPLPWLRSPAASHPPLLHIPLETQQISRYRPRPLFAAPASAPRPVALLSPSSSQQHQRRSALASSSPTQSVLAMSQSSLLSDHKGGHDGSGSRNKRRVTKREWSGTVAGAEGWRFTARAAPDLQVRTGPMGLLHQARPHSFHACIVMTDRCLDPRPRNPHTDSAPSSMRRTWPPTPTPRASCGWAGTWRHPSSLARCVCMWVWGRWVRCFAPLARRPTPSPPSPIYRRTTRQDRYLWVFGDTIIGKNATTEAWVKKGGIHAFPRQSLGAFVWLRRAPPTSVFGELMQEFARTQNCYPSLHTHTHTLHQPWPA